MYQRNVVYKRVLLYPQDRLELRLIETNDDLLERALAAMEKTPVLPGPPPDAVARVLEAAFEQIDSTWGSFDNYVARGLQLSAADVERLRANLLE